MYLAGTGMTTAVGLTTEATCAALRAKLSAFCEIPYTDVRGEAIVGAPVKAIASRRKGIDRLIDLAAPALNECLRTSGIVNQHRVALLAIVSLDQILRPGAGGLESFLERLQQRCAHEFSDESRVLTTGIDSMAAGFEIARTLLREKRVDYCVIGAVDSLLDAVTLRELEQTHRLKKPSNGDGMIPGEGACFCAWTREVVANHSQQVLQVEGIGACSCDMYATVGDVPGAALAYAMSEAFRKANVDNGQVSWEITDLTGERNLFMEHSMAVTRVFTDPQPRIDFWHPAMSIGTIGAAMGHCAIGWAAMAMRKGYAPGDRVLCTMTTGRDYKSAFLLRSLGMHRRG